MTSRPTNRIRIPGSPPLLITAVLALTVLAYLPVLSAGFLNLDDYYYITRVRPFTWMQIRRVFAGFYEGYHPLTLLSLGLDFSLFEFTAWPFHLHNLLLHLVNTTLVFLLIRKLYGGRAVPAVAALVFGLHPIHVEAVAWITSRKDVLYACFYLSALLVYAHYTTATSRWRYGLCLILFLPAVLAKGMAVAFPLSLICIDYVRNRPLLSRRVVIEKLPFLALSAFFGVVSIKAQHASGYVVDPEFMRPLMERIGLATYAAWLYVANLCAPFRLATFYPYPTADLPMAALIATGLLTVAATIATAYLIRRQKRRIVFAILFFAANTILVLQLVPVANFIAANRYAYVSSIGICLLAGLATRALAGHTASRQHRTGAAAAVGALALILGLLTHGLSKTWDNSVSLWTDTIRKQPHAAFALNMRGCAYNEQHQYAAAIADFDQAITLNRDLPRSYLNRGFAHYRLGNLAEAVADYDYAIAHDPSRPLPYNNRGLVRHAQGHLDAALADFTRAVELGGNGLQGYLLYNNLSMAQNSLGKHAEAIQNATQALVRKHNYSGAYANRGRAHEGMRHFSAALADFTAAIDLNPHDIQSRLDKAAMELALGDTQAARTTLQAAIALAGDAAQQAAARDPRLHDLQ